MNSFIQGVCAAVCVAASVSVVGVVAAAVVVVGGGFVAYAIAGAWA